MTAIEVNIISGDAIGRGHTASLVLHQPVVSPIGIFDQLTVDIISVNIMKHDYHT